MTAYFIVDTQRKSEKDLEKILGVYTEFTPLLKACEVLIKKKNKTDEKLEGTNKTGELEIYEIPEINGSYEQEMRYFEKAETFVYLFQINKKPDMENLYQIFSDEKYKNMCLLLFQSIISPAEEPSLEDVQKYCRFLKACENVLECRQGTEFLLSICRAGLKTYEDK